MLDKEWVIEVRAPHALKGFMEAFVQQYNENPDHIGQITVNDAIVKTLRIFISDRLNKGEIR